MKIAFFNIAHSSLAISILSAIAKKKGHSVKLLHAPPLFKDGLTRKLNFLSRLFNNDNEIFRQLEVYKPDLIAFSALTYNYQVAIYYAEMCKKICLHAKIVFGGIHVSCVPEIVIANEFIDYVVIGEGEIAFTEIIKHIEKGDSSEPIVNTWYKSKNNTIIKGRQAGFIQDLDSLPQFDNEIWKGIFPFTTYYLTMTSRGCPYNCLYCFNQFFKNIPSEKSNYIRRRSVKHVIEELITAKKILKIKSIEFWDDIFIFDKDWLKEFLETYKKEVALPFSCFIHVNLFDEDIATWLHQAGCKWVDFGIQNINEVYRNKYLNRNDTNADIIKTFQLLKKYKIISFIDYMIGLPGDEIEHYEEARLFFIKNTPDIIDPYWISYNPKTKILDKAIEHNILNAEKIELINYGHNPHGYYASSPGAKDYHSEYFFILKVLPSLPLWLRHKLTYELSKKIPSFIKLLILIYSIFYLAFKHDNRRAKVVIAGYTKGILWILKLKFFAKKYI